MAFTFILQKMFCFSKMRGRGRRGQFGRQDHRQNNQQQQPDLQQSSSCEVSSQPTQSSASEDCRPGQKRTSPEEENHGKDGSSDVADAQASDAKKIKLESEPCVSLLTCSFLYPFVPLCNFHDSPVGLSHCVIFMTHQLDCPIV